MSENQDSIAHLLAALDPLSREYTLQYNTIKEFYRRLTALDQLHKEIYNNIIHLEKKIQLHQS